MGVRSRTVRKSHLRRQDHEHAGHSHSHYVFTMHVHVGQRQLERRHTRHNGYEFRRFQGKELWYSKVFKNECTVRLGGVRKSVLLTFRLKRNPFRSPSFNIKRSSFFSSSVLFLQKKNPLFSSIPSTFDIGYFFTI